MTQIGHHLHKTKNKRKTKRAPHPITEHPKFIAFMDRFVFVLAIAGPLMTVPQILEIWVQHNANGVSFITWLSYFCFNILWLIYAILHRERPIIIAYTLWMCVNGAVALGALIY